jgi:Predicted glycosyltransferases
MESGLASILIPIFNGSNYLVEFLNSLKEQDYDKIQLVIRDDGSTDGSVEICTKWINENREFFHSILIDDAGEHLGLSGNISRLADMAKGEFLFLADQDDIWLRNKISYQIQYMRAHPTCICSLSDRSIADENMNIVEVSNYRYVGYKIKVLDFKEVIMHRTAYAANTMCIRGENSKNIFRLPDKIVLHDTFIAVMASHYGTVDFIFEPLLIYRVHKNNISGNYGTEFSKNVFTCFLRNYKVSKRVIKSNKYDDIIIKQELMNRFQINIDDYNNCFSRKRETSRIRFAWRVTKQAFCSKVIGIWSRR